MGKITNAQRLDPWVNGDSDDSDTVTSENTYDESSQETATNLSVTPSVVPSQEPSAVPTMEPCNNIREDPSTESSEDPRWAPCKNPIQKPSRWKLEWVSSHQDDDTTIDVSTLPTSTQLSIEVDKHATTNLKRLHTKPRVPLDPSSEVLLHHKGRTVTRDPKRTLRSMLKLPILEKYYMT